MFKLGCYHLLFVAGHKIISHLLFIEVYTWGYRHTLNCSALFLNEIFHSTAIGGKKYSKLIYMYIFQRLSVHFFHISKKSKQK